MSDNLCHDSYVCIFDFFKCATNDNFYFVLYNAVPIIYTKYWYVYRYLDH